MLGLPSHPPVTSNGNNIEHFKDHEGEFHPVGSSWVENNRYARAKSRDNEDCNCPKFRLRLVRRALSPVEEAATDDKKKLQQW